MKISSLIIILLVIFAVSGVFYWENRKGFCQNGGWSFELARTPEQHAQGLMYRKNLCDTCGMLFIFDTEKPQAFWMKDTYIPLDIYFYDARGMLVDTAYNMRPQGETKAPTIYRSKPAQYVVEVAQGSHFPANSIDILQCR